MSEKKQFLNLGCGNRYHPDWINIDIASQGQGVLQHDLSRGIPFPDSSCDVVYHAAVLEHLRLRDAEVFIAECFRVLKPGGVVRVGVPDLERICQLYLAKLSAAMTGAADAASDYDWIMLELFDQTVREKSGGEMLAYLQQQPLQNEEFVFERIGEEGRQLRDALSQQNSPSETTIVQKLLKGLRAIPGLAKRQIPFWFLGKEDRRALEIGRFRLAGEVHQWMYDRYSLARLLKLVGFCNPKVLEADISQISNWKSFHLDSLPDGQVIKPDLFFMEAVKP